MPHIKLSGRIIDENSPPYVIAEIGVNHEGSLTKARRLIELAHEGGADAAKFQAYKAGELASRHSPAYWDTGKEPTPSQYELFRKYDSFGPGEYRELAEHCQRIGIDFVSTPFSLQAVDFLAPLVPFFKVASADLTNIPLLRYIGRVGKPVVLATGSSTLAEIDTAVWELRAAGCVDLSLLHCILNYPTQDENAHIAMVSGLRRAYPDLVIGYSDHTLPSSDMVALTTAYLLGARIIEKHFTDDKTQSGNDHYHSMDRDDLATFVGQVASIRLLLGPSDHKQPVETEQVARVNARRSVVTARDIEAGATLTEDMLTCKRPGTGISPLHWDEIVGRAAVRAFRSDHILTWEDLEPQKKAADLRED